jgi:hypothetical protein
MIRSSIAEARAAYAEKIRSAVGLRSESLARALSTVPREDFLGPGPWKLMLATQVGLGYSDTPTPIRVVCTTTSWSPSTPSDGSTTASPRRRSAGSTHSSCAREDRFPARRLRGQLLHGDRRRGGESGRAHDRRRDRPRASRARAPEHGSVRWVPRSTAATAAGSRAALRRDLRGMRARPRSPGPGSTHALSGRLWSPSLSRSRARILGRGLDAARAAGPSGFAGGESGLRRGLPLRRARATRERALAATLPGGRPDGVFRLRREAHAQDASCALQRRLLPVAPG